MSAPAIAQLRAWAARDALPLLALLIAALAQIGPVLPDPRGRILGWQGDSVQYAYMTGWVGQSLLLGQSPIRDPRLNYPDGLSLAATDAPFISMLAVAPATWALGPVFGYNLIVLISGLLSGYFCYLWVRSISGSRLGGLLAGLAFLLAPYRLAHAYGHLQLVSTQGLPLFFWALDRAILAPRPRALLALAGATALVGALSQYYAVICLITGPIYALLALAWVREAPLRIDLRRASWLAGTALSVAAGAALGALPYLLTLGDRIYTPRAVETTRMWSADPLNFALPSRLHPLWGALVDQLRPEPLWIEKTLYLGAVALVLALAALWRPGALGARRWVWLGVALWAALLALGTDLHLDGRPVSEDAPIWLPAYYLAQLPFIDLMRTWSRFGVVALLFVALLAGLGAARLARGRAWAGALLIALLLLDVPPGGAESTALRPRAVDLWLAQQPGEFAVGALPAMRDDLTYVTGFGTLFHGRHAVAYNHPDHLPRAYREFVRLAEPLPREDAFIRLRQLGLRYLLLERRKFDGRDAPAWADVAAALAREPGGARVVAELDGVVVVALR